MAEAENAGGVPLPPGVAARPLRDIMEGLFKEQKHDILLRTKGHLNHNRLWTPPEMASHKPWESSSKGVPVLLEPSKIPQPKQDHKKEEEMVQAMYNFSMGTAGSMPHPGHPTPAELKAGKVSQGGSERQPSRPLPQRMDTTSPHRSSMTPLRGESRPQSQTSYIEDNAYVEEMALPELMIPVSRQKATRGISRTQSPPHRLPPFSKGEDRGTTGRNFKSRHQFVQTHLAGITKRDQFNRFLDFQKHVLRKEEMYEKGVLTGRKAVEHLERKLYEKLQELAVETRFSAPNFHRLQIYSDVWDELIGETPTFSKILRDIKTEFDLYMGSLLDTQPHRQGEILGQQVRGLTASGVVLPGELVIGQDVVKKMEEETKRLLAENDRLRETLRKENEAVSKLRPVVDVPDPVAARRRVKEEEIVLGEGDQVLEYHNQILVLQEEIQALSEDLHKNYVPKSICEHMEGCLRDTEAEVLKLLSTNEYLEKTIQSLEADVDKLLEKYDAPDTDIRAIWKSINTTGSVPFPGI